MPIIIPNDLPATDVLKRENFFVMSEGRAGTQDIRTLEILVVNLMPTKIATETQIARMLANSPIQVRLTLLRTESHEQKHTSQKHLDTFYKTFDEVKDRRFDGMILTGAPLDFIDFEDVDYWEINEAFAAQYLGVEKKLKEEHGWVIDPDKVNRNGSGISLGHPIGCTGLRIIVTMLYEMERNGDKIGCASLCVGGGPSMASLWTREV